MKKVVGWTSFLVYTFLAAVSIKFKGLFTPSESGSENEKDINV